MNKGVYILNTDFSVAAIIDNYVSCIWTCAYNEIGDFELYLSADKKIMDVINMGDHYFVRAQDISVSNGVVTYNKVMVMTDVQLTTDAEAGDYLTIRGKELKYLLHRRIIVLQTNLTGTAEDGIRQLITNNAIDSTTAGASRVIPNLTLATAVGFTDTIEKQLTGDYLDEAVAEICKSYDYGWDMYISNNQLIVKLYQGVDRSYRQNVRPYVVFSDKFENLYNTGYEAIKDGYANTFYVYGEGEGTSRERQMVGGGSGLNRYEYYVDARDLSRNEGTDEEITKLEYKNLLRERGMDEQANHRVVKRFSGEVLDSVVFKFGEDYYLGDTVRVVNAYGIGENVKVTSCIEYDDDAGTRLLPQFNFEEINY